MPPRAAHTHTQTYTLLKRKPCVRDDERMFTLTVRVVLLMDVYRLRYHVHVLLICRRRRRRRRCREHQPRGALEIDKTHLACRMLWP